MKIRTDFVSNSSSSSFVFSADFRKYGFDEFVRSVCDACDDGENDGRTRENNEAILMYCMKYFELLHLGRIVRGRIKQTIRRGYTSTGEKITDPNDIMYSDFENIKRELIDRREVPEYCADDNPSAKMVADDVIEYEYDDFAPDRIIVAKQYMSNVIRGHFWKNGERLTGTAALKQRANAILKTIAQAESAGNNVWRTPYRADTYLITRNTISNTRDLIAAGYDVRLEEWENLDGLESRLAAGETLFHIECADAGEGESDTGLFSHGSTNPFLNCPFEQIRNDW